MTPAPAALVKVGGSLLRRHAYAESEPTIRLLAEVAASQRLVLMNGSLDLPSTIESYLAHVALARPREPIEALAREAVAQVLAAAHPLVALAKSPREVELSWQAGFAPLLSPLSFGQRRAAPAATTLTSTGRAYLTAVELGAAELVVLTDVDGVWSDSDTKKIEPVLDTAQLRALPTSCIDQGLADLIEDHGLPVTVLNGKRADVVRSFLFGARTGLLGTTVLGAPQQGSHDLSILASFLSGNGFCSRGDLAASRRIAEAYRDRPSSDWALDSAFDRQGDANHASYCLAIALERLGAAVVGGLLPLPLLLTLASDQVCIDWLACRHWVRGYREKDGAGFAGDFRRRYAEACFAICSIHLLERYASLLSPELGAAITHEAQRCQAAISLIAAEAEELSGLDLRSFVR